MKTQWGRLSAEDLDLWLGVAATVTRQRGARIPEAPSVPGPEAAEPVAAVPQRSFYAAPYTPVPPAASVKLAPIERKLKQKLARGRIGADAAIDLHGLRQGEAHAALRAFLRKAQRNGAHIVLVVTGKGGRGEPLDVTGDRVGVLKRTVPLWLASLEFRPLVLGFDDAGRVHGGTGALYVRLRRGV